MPYTEFTDSKTLYNNEENSRTNYNVKLLNCKLKQENRACVNRVFEQEQQAKLKISELNLRLLNPMCNTLALLSSPFFSLS